MSARRATHIPVATHTAWGVLFVASLLALLVGFTVGFLLGVTL